MRTPSTAAFTLIEVLSVLVVIAILSVLLFSVAKRGISRAQSVKCVGNLRQIGAAAAAYGAENNNEWPFYGTYDYPTNQGAWITRLLRSGTVWTGLGKTYPYHQDKRLFYCPGDTSPTVQALTTRDWSLTGTGGIDGTYLVRGYGQTKPRPLGKTYATLGRRSIASCQWAYSASSPVKLPLAFHEGGYPVLFSDGSVQIIPFPAGSVDRDHPPDIWNNNTLQTSVWEFFDGKLTTDLKLK